MRCCHDWYNHRLNYGKWRLIVLDHYQLYFFNFSNLGFSISAGNYILYRIQNSAYLSMELLSTDFTHYLLGRISNFQIHIMDSQLYSRAVAQSVWLVSTRIASLIIWSFGCGFKLSKFILILSTSRLSSWVRSIVRFN